MEALTIVLLAFAVFGAIDRAIGCKLGIGKEFEKAFMLLGVTALTMIGMITISPLLARLMMPVSSFVATYLHLDPSIIPASLFANDMGGASLSLEMAADEGLGFFNGLVVSSMMGCTISYTVPFALGIVKKELHGELLFGILCGIITIPAGCLVGGFVCGIPFLMLIADIAPLVIFSVIIAIGLVKFTDLCVKVFKWIGFFITAVIMLGLSLGMINFVLGREVISGLVSVEEGLDVCFNGVIVLAGALPLVYAISRILAKPLRAIGNRAGINEYSVVGLFSTISTSSTMFPIMDKMDKKGVVLCAAFSVSGAFTVGAHLAFTIAFNKEYLLAVVVGKLIAGVCAILLANVIYARNQRKKEK